MLLSSQRLFLHRFLPLPHTLQTLLQILTSLQYISSSFNLLHLLHLLWPSPPPPSITTSNNFHCSLHHPLLLHLILPLSLHLLFQLPPPIAKDADLPQWIFVIFLCPFTNELTCTAADDAPTRRNGNEATKKKRGARNVTRLQEMARLWRQKWEEPPKREEPLERC